MSCILVRVCLSIFLFNAGAAIGQEQQDADPKFGERIADSPFVELYVLDELKALRKALAEQKLELHRDVMDREHAAIDRAVTYATDTVTYFFYLIAGVSSILVVVGWSSVREIKERVHSVAEEEITKLVSEYEKRLNTIEFQLSQKTRHIEENREEIELTQQIQALWLRAALETNPANKIPVYDQILKLRFDDSEALTYKADAVLELNEPQWAVNLCQQALEIDPQNHQAFYQLACAYATMEMPEEALRYLGDAISLQDAYREEAENEVAFIPFRSHATYRTLIGLD